jgi:hypothetical protein
VQGCILCNLPNLLILLFFPTFLLFFGIDPHFKTWHGNHFSYHGKCDLVLLKNDHFSDGLGILVHVRTKIEKTWSYVKNAAVKIGNDILEIEGEGQVWDKSAEAVHSINGKVNAELPFQLAMKFPVTRLEEKH